MTRVVVTGGAGKLGRAVVRDLDKARDLLGYRPQHGWRDPADGP